LTVKFCKRALVMSTTTLLAAGLAVLTPVSASAAPHLQTPPSVQIGYTDLAHPFTPYGVTNRGLPLGAWRDDNTGRVHVSRVYATFDVASLAGKPIIGGTVTIQEVTAGDCTKRAIEIWQTRPISQTPSWIGAPRGLRKLDEITTADHCPAFISFDVSTAVRDAIDHRQQRITFELRVPFRHEFDTAYGRWLSTGTQVGLSVEYNSPPTLTVGGLSDAGFPCVQSAPFPARGYRAGLLQAQANDPDPEDLGFLDYEFAVWPTATPAARTVLRDDNRSVVGGVNIPNGVLVDGRTYSWQVRVSDGADTSPWSAVCSFVNDQTRPAAPTVTSANYPPSANGPVPIGEPGTFTFAATDSDTVGFQYGWEMLGVIGGCETKEFGRVACTDPFSVPGTVRADRPGGTATVTVNPPGPPRGRLLVRSIDSAGQISPEVAYEVFVRFDGAPTIIQVGDQPRWDKPITLRFSPYPGITGTTGYEYRINGFEPHTVAAGPDGAATITFSPPNLFYVTVEVRSKSANGWISPNNSWQVFFPPGAGVSSDIYLANGLPGGGVGVTGTFTFTPPGGWTEIRGYEYSFPFDGTDPVFVPAGPDGTATVTWTPEASGFVEMDVRGIRPDGTPGDDVNPYFFEVA
jgi:hypothetical protein